MFRKRTKKPGQNLRRKRTDEANKDDDDEDDEATGIAIRKTMKKQKILASLPLTSSIPKSKDSNADEKQPQAAAPKPSELSVLATKHVRNMEAYIEEKMAEATQQTNGAAEKRQSSEETDPATTTSTSEEDLYRQLAREVTNSGGVQEQEQQQAQNDGDQGDGGAALLVGTGIAEVILPATSHRPVALSTTNRVWNKNNSMLSSAVPEGERHKHVLSKTTPKPFVKFRNNQNSALPHNNNSNEGSNHRDEGTKEEETSQTNSSSARQGFDAFRGRAPAAETEGDKESNHSNNNRWKTGKDRDDQVYSHFLKNALNGKRR